VKRKKIDFRSNCPISTALDIFGDKWSLLILRDLIFNNKSTYGEFLDTEEKIATNVLADRLLTLEAGGIISRHDHPESKVKVLYKLTDKGIDLIPMLVEMIVWSEKHHKVHPHAVQFAKMVRKDKEGLIKRLRDSLKRA
jgi:DNA-binding HxlR family transcriptional regulator